MVQFIVPLVLFGEREFNFAKADFGEFVKES